jgi:hypothetical protein
VAARADDHKLAGRSPCNTQRKSKSNNHESRTHESAKRRDNAATVGARLLRSVAHVRQFTARCRCVAARRCDAGASIVSLEKFMRSQESDRKPRVEHSACGALTTELLTTSSLSDVQPKHLRRAKMGGMVYGQIRQAPVRQVGLVIADPRARG